MHWFYKKLDYEILPPKLSKTIFQLSEKEAADFFEWFIENIPARIGYVSKMCATELGVPIEKMDCSPESLILLWKWFRRRAKLETAGSGQKQLSLETEYILRDIGMYLGETFRRNIPNIYWAYYTKPARDFFVNHPLLKGFVERYLDKRFEACFEPIHMAGVQAAKLIDRSSKDTDLFAIYNLWAQKIE